MARPFGGSGSAPCGSPGRASGVSRTISTSAGACCVGPSSWASTSSTRPTPTAPRSPNRYNLADRGAEDVLGACTERGIGFIPWFPLATGSLAEPGGPLDDVARAHDATPGQIALAWLLARSPVMLPIPGTASVVHLEENLGASRVELSEDEVGRLAEIGAG